MEKTNGTEKKFEIVEHNGQMVRKYPNGTLRGEHGHIVKGGLPSDKAREMRQERNQQGTETAREAMRRAAGTETFDEAWAKVVTKAWEIAMTDTGRAGQDSRRWLGMLSDAYNPTRAVDVRGTVTHRAEPVPQLPESYYIAMEKLAREEGIVIDAQEIIDDAQTNEN